MSDTDRKSEEHHIENEETEIGVTRPLPPNGATEGSTIAQTQHEEHERRLKRFFRRMKNVLLLVLGIGFWVAIIAAVVLGKGYGDIPAGAGIGIAGLLLIFLGVTVINEKKITSSFSDDPHALEETYVGKDAVMLGLFFIFLGILFLCGCGYIFYSRIAN